MMAFLLAAKPTAAFWDFLSTVPDEAASGLSGKDLSANPRLLYNSSLDSFNNVTQLALVSGALLFLGLNTAFAFAFLNPEGKKEDEGSRGGYYRYRR